LINVLGNENWRLQVEWDAFVGSITRMPTKYTFIVSEPTDQANGVVVPSRSRGTRLARPRTCFSSSFLVLRGTDDGLTCPVRSSKRHGTPGPKSAGEGPCWGREMDDSGLWQNPDPLGTATGADGGPMGESGRRCGRTGRKTPQNPLDTSIAPPPSPKPPQDPPSPSQPGN